MALQTFVDAVEAVVDLPLTVVMTTISVKTTRPDSDIQKIDRVTSTRSGFKAELEAVDSPSWP